MTIRNWPLAERPRERLLAQGAKALSDAELLAIFLRTGHRGQNALDLARKMLSEFGSLGALMNASFARASKVAGLGLAKWASLQAALELATRAGLEAMKDTPLMNRPEAAEAYLRQWLRFHPFEVFVALFMDNRHHLIVCEELFRGTVNQTAVYPREVVRRCLELNACAVIFAHNHPSGAAEPSRADEVLTENLRKSLASVGVEVLDHLIVAGPSCTSLARRGCFAL
jgi:DNA repair protein RadC